jgi:hypothetical protein
MSFDHLVITLTFRFMYAAKNHERIFRENRSERRILFFFLSREFIPVFSVLKLLKRSDESEMNNGRSYTTTFPCMHDRLERCSKSEFVMMVKLNSLNK